MMTVHNFIAFLLDKALFCERFYLRSDAPHVNIERCLSVDTGEKFASVACHSNLEPKHIKARWRITIKTD